MENWRLVVQFLAMTQIFLPKIIIYIIYTRGRLGAHLPPFIPVCSDNNNNAVLNKCSWNIAAMILKEDQRSWLKIEYARVRNARQSIARGFAVNVHYLTVQWQDGSKHSKKVDKMTMQRRIQQEL